mgnify:CR=1 FL=1
MLPNADSPADLLLYDFVVYHGVTKSVQQLDYNCCEWLVEEDGCRPHTVCSIGEHSALIERQRKQTLALQPPEYNR